MCKVKGVKAIEDMTDEELLALTDEDINRRVMLSLAEEGVPLLEEPEPPKYPDIPEPDGHFWWMASLDPLLFHSSDDVSKVLSVLREMKCCTKVRNWSFPEEHFVDKVGVNHYGEAAEELSAVKVRSEGQIKGVRGLVEKKKELQQDYNERVKEFEKYLKRREEVEDAIREPIRGARQRLRDREVALVRMKEYYALAENNFEVALRFYGKAYSFGGRMEDYLRGEFGCPLLPEVEDKE
jgi:hypothetical protein